MQILIDLDSVLARRGNTVLLLGLNVVLVSQTNSDTLKIKEEEANFHHYYTDDGIIFLTKRDLWRMMDKIIDFCWTCYLLP